MYSSILSDMAGSSWGVVIGIWCTWHVLGCTTGWEVVAGTGWEVVSDTGWDLVAGTGWDVVVAGIGWEVVAGTS